MISGKDSPSSIPLRKAKAYRWRFLGRSDLVATSPLVVTSPQRWEGQGGEDTGGEHRPHCAPLPTSPPIVFGSIFARWQSFLMQPFERGDQLRLPGPPAEGATEHLIGAFGRH